MGKGFLHSDLDADMGEGVETGLALKAQPSLPRAALKFFLGLCGGSCTARVSLHGLWMELGANAKPGVQNPSFSSPKKHVYCLLAGRGMWTCLREALGRQGRRDPGQTGRWARGFRWNERNGL